MENKRKSYWMQVNQNNLLKKKLYK